MHLFALHYLEFVKSIGPESRLRLAPTPSGFLHLGNGLNFVLHWLAARFHSTKDATCDASAVKPELLLRIDDLDADRKRPEYLQDIFETLDWLQIDWRQPAIQQSDPSRQALYAQALARLRALDLVFACQKSRRDLEPFGGAYPPEFRHQNLSLDASDVAWRIKTPPGFPLPDFIVRRRDGVPAYQLASFVDELDLGITHVLRGEDLRGSTLAQQYLAKVLSEGRFARLHFFHHPLMLAPGGEKLSKSAGSTALKSLREAGQGPEPVFRTAAQWLGLEADSATSLLQALQRQFG